MTIASSYNHVIRHVTLKLVNNSFVTSLTRRSVRVFLAELPPPRNNHVRRWPFLQSLFAGTLCSAESRQKPYTLRFERGLFACNRDVVGQRLTWRHKVVRRRALAQHPSSRFQPPVRSFKVASKNPKASERTSEAGDPFGLNLSRIFERTST